MSSYIVEHKTIDRVLSWIACNRHHSHNSMYVPSELREVWDCDKFGLALLKMNHKAVSQRYSGQPKTKVTYKFTLIGSPQLSDSQALKSASCLLYQCSEGNVPNSKLYKLLKLLTERMKSKIVDSLASYNDAEWG